MSGRIERDVVAANTQNTYESPQGEVSIGAGNFWEREYLTADGERRHGPTTALWLSVRGHLEEAESLDVYPGCRFEKRGLKFRVDDVTSDRVMLSFEYPDAPP